ncbi:MAG: hypothetical protein ACWA49_05910 [Ruegeria sp.]
MMILKDPKLVFIKTKKTAGTSIEIALSSHLNEGDFATPFNKEEERQRPGKQYIVRRSMQILRDRADGAVQARYPHNGIEVVNTYLADFAEGCTSFCVERNPWDKAVSAFYFWMHQRGTEINDPNTLFAQFCRTRLKFFSDFHLYSRDGEISVDRVLQYEQLDRELGSFLRQRGLGDVDLGGRRWNSTTRKTRKFDVFYGENWDSENVELVANVFSQEISAFGYDTPSSASATGQDAVN